VLALVIRHELVIGQSTLVQRGPFLVLLGLRSRRRRFLLGDAGPALRDFRLARSILGLRPVLVGHDLTPLAELSLTGSQPGSLTHPGQRQHDPDQEHDYDDDDDD
jgi:hypothetical protein